MSDLHAGQYIGHLLLLRRLRPKRIGKTGFVTGKQWKVRCDAPITFTGQLCKTELTVFQAYLIRKVNPKVHCGCQGKTLKTLFNREYRIWLMMNVRCFDPRHVAYKDYGGRGIRVCDAWSRGAPDGFGEFFRHIGKAPTIKHSVDRIDVDNGYQPGNVRWATSKEQAQNKRKKGV